MASQSEQRAMDPGTERARRPVLRLAPELTGDPRVGVVEAEAGAALAGSASEGEADAPVFLLTTADGALELRPPDEHDRAGVRAPFPPDAGAAGRDPLARAFGRRVDRILDVTAGFGGDAYRLARAGFDVEAVERDAVVFALVADGWRAAQSQGLVPEDVAARLRFAFGDARQVLPEAPVSGLGVFVDPMYPPPRRASARPRRALQVLRGWLDDDGDAGEVVARARACAARVVVKRPHHAEPLAPDVSHTIESKLVRFDVYVHPERLLEVAE